MYIYISNLTEMSQCFIYQKPGVASDFGLAPNKRQAITKERWPCILTPVCFTCPQWDNDQCALLKQIVDVGVLCTLTGIDALIMNVADKRNNSRLVIPYSIYLPEDVSQQMQIVPCYGCRYGSKCVQNRIYRCWKTFPQSFCVESDNSEDIYHSVRLKRVLSYSL